MAIALADATDHAMKAAIPVVMFSGILQSQMELGGSVEELLRRLNRSLHATLERRTFVCFTMGALDPASRILSLSNGGCPYPYHYRAASHDVVELEMQAYPLGIRPDTAYQAMDVQLEPGDRVVFCSDGIVEAGNADQDIFGFDRTADSIRTACEEDLSAELLLERVLADVQAFSGDAPQDDDITCVVLRVEA